MPSVAALSLFRLIVLVFVALMQLYLYFRVSSHFKNPGSKFYHYRQYVKIPFILFYSPLIYFAFLRPVQLNGPAWLKFVTLYPFYIWHASSLLLFVFLFVGNLLKLPFQLLLYLLKKVHLVRQGIENFKQRPKFQAFDSSRRTFLKSAAYAFSTYSIVGSTYGILRKNHYQVVDQIVQIPHLPDKLKGLTIGLISDVHSGLFMSKEEMDEYVQALSGLKTDLIVVPGDFVTSLTKEIYSLAESFSELKAPYGVYGCLGNHDFFATVDPDEITKRLEDSGMKMLRNDSVIIEFKGEKLALLGVDDILPWKSAPQLIGQAKQGVPDGIPKVLLCHKPYFFPDAAQHKIDLTLSGHTHGGQVVLFELGTLRVTPAALASHYVSGLYTIDKSQMYVTKGIGTVGMPLRLNCPPEITKIILA